MRYRSSIHHSHPRNRSSHRTEDHLATCSQKMGSRIVRLCRYVDYHCSLIVINIIMKNPILSEVCVD